MSEKMTNSAKIGNMNIVTAAPSPMRPDDKDKLKAVSAKRVVASFGPPRVNK